MSEQVQHIYVLRLKAEAVSESRNFCRSVSGQFLCGCEPRPNIRTFRFLPCCSLQKRYCFRSLAELAIVDPKKKIGARQRRLDLQRPTKLCHCCRGPILKLVY